ncbi:MAG: TraB/GumN family protein [Prevotella sp.]|nr:TraB/GumN family protein [Prevotella sp.]MCM1074748.1 TraB/GumN family protein [Ruminococcus sp.]
MRFIRLIFANICALAALCPFNAKAQLLWKVEKSGSEQVSYLLGTHHFAPVEILDSIHGLYPALAQVDKLYGEIDMEKMSNPAEMMKFAGKLMAPADSTLTKILTVEELDTVKTTWNKMSGGVAPIETMYGMKPSVVTTALMSMVMMQRFPDKDFQAPGIDQLMQNKAKEAGKEVAGLEDIEFQINLLYGDPISEQKEALMDAVRNGGYSEIEEMLRVTDAYLARNLDYVGELMTDPQAMTPEKADRLVFNRNAKWVDILISEMQDKSIMVIVGAGHLPSDKGLINLLRKGGYTVTPVD